MAIQQLLRDSLAMEELNELHMKGQLGGVMFSLDVQDQGCLRQDLLL